VPPDPTAAQPAPGTTEAAPGQPAPGTDQGAQPGTDQGAQPGTETIVPPLQPQQ